MFSYLEVILLHICIFAKISAGYGNCNVSFSDTDHILTGHVIQTLNHKTFESCTFSCELEPQCFSVNYISLHKTCNLNNATKKYFPGDLLKQKGAVYMDMVIRSYDPCESMRCENGGTCVSSPSVKCKCVDGYSGFQCEKLQALGMQSGAIPDVKIQASSSKTGYEPWKGRLNGNSCWMSAQNQNDQYIAVSFATKVTIVAIATQGAPLNGCWVKSYFIKWGYQNTILSYAKQYQANSDKNTVVTNMLSTHIHNAEWVGIYPSSWASCIAIRLEVYGY